MAFIPDRGLGSAATAWIPAQAGGSYRWFTGSLAFVLHRVTGLGLLVFLIFHIISITKATHSPESYDLMIARMQAPDFKIGELFLFAALVIHGLNGLRILFVDFVVARTAAHKRSFWGFAILAVVLLTVGSIPLILHSNVQPLLNTEALPGATFGGGK